MTIFDKIIAFTSEPKFFPAGSNPATDQPRDPVGPSSNQLPLSRNVSFYFNYTQGTIERLEIVETQANVNVTIANLTVPAGTDPRTMVAHVKFNTVS